MMIYERLKPVWWALRITFGVLPIVAGLDKFFDLLTRWEQYLNPLATRIVPLTPHHFMMVVGVIEMISGVVVLSPYLRFGAVMVGFWLAAIAINLLSTGHYLDIAARDLAMSVAAFGLARLEAVRATRGEGVPERRQELRPADSPA
jgi:uncharacterized membrane protein YphA (DoxX/SURF4 family)